MAVIKVILSSDIPNLGKIGEIKEVKLGFARNYLFPKNLAKPFTPQAMKEVEKIKKIEEEKKNRELTKANQIAQKLESLEISIARPVHEEKKLFGSISASEVVGALKEKGIEISPRQVFFDAPIKEVGIYEVEIKLHPEVVAKVKLWITPKE
ncbi:MAG: 50S ribosomal protein L9 [Elusimicrobia bacterium]|nr:50S ribosomal protein L9 [Elusimicrobiota bacterium]